MKFRTLTAYFFLIAGSVLWLGNKDGRANGGNEGATGAPNDNPSGRTCQNCHNSSSLIQVTLDIEMLDQNMELVEVYEPGETYTVRVRVNSVGTTQPSGYGFQMVCLTNDLAPVNNWEAQPPVGIQITTLNNGRAYAEHLQPSPDNFWEIEWTAPDAGTGPVTFYAGGNGVNLNNNDSGDHAAINQLTISEFGTVATKETGIPSDQYALFPNPVSDVLLFDWYGEPGSSVTISIFDQMGRRLLIRNIPQGSSQLQLPVAELPSGLYYLEVLQDSKRATSRFVKL